MAIKAATSKQQVAAARKFRFYVFGLIDNVKNDNEIVFAWAFDYQERYTSNY